MGSFSLLFEWLEMPPWFSILSIILAIAGIAWGVYSYAKSRKIRLPYYAVRSVNIVSDLVSKIRQLEMLYAGQRIENLTATKVLFWNAGRETINSQDVASADPITVRAKNGCKILDASILQAKEPANRFSIPSFDQSRVPLHFEYIDKDQGVVIQILHTGKSGEDLEIIGTIKGAGKLNRRSLPAPPLSYQMKPIVWNGLLFISTLASGAVMAMIWMSPRTTENLYLMGMLSMLLYTDIMIMLDLLRKRIPRGFDAFKEEI